MTIWIQITNLDRIFLLKYDLITILVVENDQKCNDLIQSGQKRLKINYIDQFSIIFFNRPNFDILITHGPILIKQN